MEGAGSKLHTTAHAAALATLQRAGLTRLPAELTALYCSMNDDRKFARDVGAHPTIAHALSTGRNSQGSYSSRCRSPAQHLPAKTDCSNWAAHTHP